MLLFQYLIKMLKKQHLRFLEINEIFLWCETPKLVLMKENVLFFVLGFFYKVKKENNKERKTTKTVFSFFVLFNFVKKNKKERIF
jgi:hypothetical protein